MSEPISAATKADMTRTSATRVMCGGPEWGRHPKVYLTMGDDAKGRPSHVVCPYCSHAFHHEPQAPRLTSPAPTS